MGQKSNIITLREYNKNLSFLENEKEYNFYMILKIDLMI